jgi:hypothetical protein
MRYFELLNPATEMDIEVGRNAGPISIKIPTKLEAHWENLSFNTWTYSEARQRLDSAEPYYKDSTYEGKIGYLKLNTFMVSADEIRSAVGKLKDSNALIIDVRGNGGGSMDALTTLVGLLLNDPYEMANMVFRAKSQPVKAKLVRPIIGAPVYVLVDSSSASASEIFARSLQIQKRGLVIGDKTSGRVNVARFFPESIGADLKSVSAWKLLWRVLSWPMAKSWKGMASLLMSFASRLATTFIGRQILALTGLLHLPGKVVINRASRKATKASASD